MNIDTLCINIHRKIAQEKFRRTIDKLSLESEIALLQVSTNSSLKRVRANLYTCIPI